MHFGLIQPVTNFSTKSSAYYLRSLEDSSDVWGMQCFCRNSKYNNTPHQKKQKLSLFMAAERNFRMKHLFQFMWKSSCLQRKWRNFNLWWLSKIYVFDLLNVSKWVFSPASIKTVAQTLKKSTLIRSKFSQNIIITNLCVNAGLLSHICEANTYYPC